MQLWDVSKPQVRDLRDNIRLALLTVQQQDMELVSCPSSVSGRGERQPLASHPSPKFTEPEILIEGFYLAKIVTIIHGKEKTPNLLYWEIYMILI